MEIPEHDQGVGTHAADIGQAVEVLHDVLEKYVGEQGMEIFDAYASVCIGLGLCPGCVFAVIGYHEALDGSDRSSFIAGFLAGTLLADPDIGPRLREGAADAVRVAREQRINRRVPNGRRARAGATHRGRGRKR